MSPKSFPNSFVDWLARVTSADRPPKSVIAFNIGLLETESGYSAYLVGADEFDETDSEWACNEAFTPTERYCPIPGESFDDWQDVHNAVVLATKSFLDSANGKQSFLSKAQAVTVGFDDGELERVK